MWVSNTATSIMMLPIGLSVIAMMERGNSEKASQRYATALLLAIAYSDSIGGVATLIGTPPNALLAAYLSESQGISIGFSQWMLFGGGLAMAGVISSTGLADWIAAALAGSAGLPAILMIALITLVIIFLTEVTSNTATAAAFLPLLGALAVAQGVPAPLFAVPAALAASCAFMMPVATPPNAIVFSGGHVRIGDMIRTGFALNLIGVVVVTGFSYLLVGLVFSAG